MSNSSSVRFSVDSHLLLELGERLVARRSIALAELVKNAYDADATKVIVRLENVTKIGGTIVVQDDGHGMTFETLLAGWMLIATGEKRDLRNPISRKYKRIMTGAKGIGRFACRVLSDKLILESVATVASGQKEKITATFDWARFKSGSKVDEVSVPYRKEKVSFDIPTGTKLILEKTREPWGEKDVNDLRNDLLSLISEFSPEIEQVQESGKKIHDPGFQVIIQAPEFPEFEGPMAKQFLRYSWATLVGRISSDGSPTFDLHIRKLKKRLRFRPDRKFSEIGEAFFRVYLFVYRKDYFENIPISLADARKMGRERGGVRIFLDKFRVFPYGESTDDWLNLDADKSRRITAFQEITEQEEDLIRPMLFLPGNNQLFGAVLLSRVRNPNITLTVTRDRLLANRAFDELRRFVRLGIEWMTIQYARYAPETRGPRVKPDPLKPLDDAKKKILNKANELGAESTAEIVQILDLAKQAFENRENERISEISMLRVLATTGTLVSVFQHELSTMIRALARESKALFARLDELPPEHKSKLLDSSKRLQDWADSIEEYASQVGRMIGRESRDRPRSYPLQALIDEMVAPFSYHLSEQHIEFINHLPADLHLPPMFRCEIYSVFLNLITNSIKAVKKSSVRKISITGARADNAVKILVLDTGHPVPAERREEVFEPFVSDSEPDLLFGEGTGLGLTITRNTLDTYGGTVRFIDPPANWVTCVEIILPES
jgi:signal transduction histidine kinase